jgi:serine/threonine protein kinase
MCWLHHMDVSDARVKDAIVREIDVKGALDHPGLQRLLTHFWPETSGDESPTVVVVYEAMEGGSLEWRLFRDKRLAVDAPVVPFFEGMSELHLLRGLKQVVETMSTLHACSPALRHHHLKPSTIVFDCYGNCVLADLSATKEFAELQDRVSAHEPNDSSYWSPQRMQDGAAYTDADDVWAIGLIALQIGLR